jgi:hypothetical protein
MKDIILCIAGSRHFQNYKLFLHILEIKWPEIEKHGKVVKIIQGECPNGGVDLMAKWYAKEKGIECQGYPADWGQYGKAAGPMRNTDMSRDGDVLFAYHIEGRGSMDVMNKFYGKSKPVIEVRV